MSVFCVTSAALLLAAVPACDTPLHIQHAERSANAHRQLHLLPESPRLKNPSYLRFQACAARLAPIKDEE